MSIIWFIFFLKQARDSSYTRLGSARESKEWTPRHHYRPSGYRGGHFPSDHFEQGIGQQFQAGSSMEPPRPTTDSINEPSVSNAGDMEAEWIEEDEPGVYITIRQLADGTRELRRVRFRYQKLCLILLMLLSPFNLNIMILVHSFILISLVVITFFLFFHFTWIFPIQVSSEMCSILFLDLIDIVFHKYVKIIETKETENTRNHLWCSSNW